MKVGDHVTRKDSEIVGTIISLHGSQAQVYWSQHFSQLVDLEKLILAKQIQPHRNPKGKHR